ncbi:colorectal cancer associated 2 [Mugil cephalus]|uniref:colorectal cancer associated 2 n=1 Tax=Mugil cephalus TaxID=48193 RepID=UPI001FB57E1B|nr:colorectal cancer associated 2 [Mugil cephalus]
MSDKPRVYQGVRVKTTVKELLQRHRAREANSKKLKTACLELPELCAFTLSSRHVDPPVDASSADSSSCVARALQVRTPSFPVPENPCSIQMQQQSAFNEIQQQQQQQIGDAMLPGNGYSCSNNNNNLSAGHSYSTPLPLPPISPLPWCHGLSSDADYYGHGMAPCSSSESLVICNSMDHNSYSPQDSFSSSSSSCYDSPTRMESGYNGFTSEHYHYQHCNPQDCYCLPHCWPGQQESFPAVEYSPFFNPTDYPYACTAEENYFRRDFQ